MAKQAARMGATSKTERAPLRFEFWIAILTALTAVVALGIAINTLPRSGPFCTIDSCITYPYTDAAAFVPNDFTWMYPASLMVMLFSMLVICVHHATAFDKKIFTQIALSFAIISATVLLADYFVQLAVVQPSLLLGEVEGLSVWSQYNPHGVFIALENLGFLLMSVAFLFCGLAWNGKSILERSIRGLFFLGFFATLGALVALLFLFGMNIEYRFEVFAILITWLVLIVNGALLGVFFNRHASVNRA